VYEHAAAILAAPVSVITSVGHTDMKFYYQCGVLIDLTDGATLLSKVLAQTN